LPRFAEKSVDNLLEALEKSKKIDLAKFIMSLSIDQVGEETAIDLANTFGSFKKFEQASFEALDKIDGVGNVAAQAIVGWFKNKENQLMVGRLLEKVDVVDSKKISQKLAGKTFVLTGTLSKMGREDAKDRIRRLGGSVSGSISVKTDFLVGGEKGGSKLTIAGKLGVKVLNEKEFLKMVN
jgi:DNA ligase (NAD+)